jgi:hypothetical protein
LDFDHLIAWLDARLGQRVHASMSRPGSDLGMHAGGALERHVEEMVLIAPSQAAAYTVAESLIVLPKGDFTAVEFSDTPPAWAEARFGDVKVTFVDAA